MKEHKPVKLFGLRIHVEPVALVGSVVLMVLLIGFTMRILHLPIQAAITGSLLAVVLHWISTLVHHLGHAWAARRTGHPMTGIRFGMLGLLGRSLYPADEPALPAHVHIRRALGGPITSFVFTLIALILALVFRAVDDTLEWVGMFFFLENLFVFTLGVFLPLGFTDGSILLRWWGKR